MATQRGRRRLPGKPHDSSVFLGGDLLRPPPRRDFAVLLVRLRRSAQLAVGHQPGEVLE